MVQISDISIENADESNGYDYRGSESAAFFLTV